MVLIYTDPAIASGATKKDQNGNNVPCQVGDAVLDPAGNPVSNAIGCLVYQIQLAFCGFPETQAGVNLTYLSKLKCKDLTQFEQHFNLFVSLVYHFADPLNQLYVDMFLASLPTWFVNRLYALYKEGFNGKTLGFVRQVCHAEIIQTCQSLSFQRATAKAEKIGAYKALRKQRGLGPPEWETKSHFRHRSSRPITKMGGDKDKDKQHKRKKHSSKRKHSSRKYQHESKSHKHASHGKDEKKKHQKKIQCYTCGGNHYSNHCPKKKSGKINLHEYVSNSSSSSYDSTSSSSDNPTCNCYGKCSCDDELHMHEGYQKSIDLIARGISTSTDPQQKEAYYRMLTEQVNLAAKTEAEDQKKKAKEVAYFPYISTDDLMQQFQEKPKVALTIDSFYQEFQKEIKSLKKSVEHLYMIAGQQHSPLSSMPQSPRYEAGQTSEAYVPKNKGNQHLNQFISGGIEDLTLNLHTEILSSPEPLLSYVIRVPSIFVSDPFKRITKFKVLVDTGARMNTINPLFVPVEFRQPCTSLEAIRTSTGSQEVKWQTEIKIYLSEVDWVQVTVILFPCLTGMLLGAPFLSQVLPFKVKEYKPRKYGYQFSLNKQKHFFKFIPKN